MSVQQLQPFPRTLNDPVRHGGPGNVNPVTHPDLLLTSQRQPIRVFLCHDVGCSAGRCRALPDRDPGSGPRRLPGTSLPSCSVRSNQRLNQWRSGMPLSPVTALLIGPVAIQVRRAESPPKLNGAPAPSQALSGQKNFRFGNTGGQISSKRTEAIRGVLPIQPESPQGSSRYLGGPNRNTNINRNNNLQHKTVTMNMDLSEI